MIVKERKSVFVMKTLESGKEWFDERIDVNFIPDELRIVQVLYVPDAGDIEGVYTLSMNSLGELCFFDAGHQASNANIRINTHGRSYQGLQRFTVHDIDGNSEILLQGQLGIVIEFIKY